LAKTRGCYSTVLEVIEEGSKRFSSIFEENKDKVRDFEAICTYIDTLIKKYNCEYYEIEIEDGTTDISIAVTCAEVTFDTEDDPIYVLLDASQSASFSYGEKKNTICIKLTFCGVWDPICCVR